MSETTTRSVSAQLASAGAARARAARGRRRRWIMSVPKMRRPALMIWRNGGRRQSVGFNDISRPAPPGLSPGSHAAGSDVQLGRLVGVLLDEAQPQLRLAAH